MEKKDEIVCSTCGQLHDAEYTAKLWDVYHRLEGGRQHQEPLVFTGDWLQENVLDEEDFQSVNYAMEIDMHRRGLCTACGRPDLRGVTSDQIMSEEDARDLADMYAEMAAERRAGC